MYRIKFDTLKDVLTSPYWLVLTLAGAFCSFFALNRGGIVLFIEISFGFFLLNLITGKYIIKRIPIAYWITLAICTYLMLGSVLVSPHDFHYRWMANLVRMLGVIFAIHCLSQKKINPRIHILFPIILSFTVIVHFAARYVFHLPYGTYSNPHYLASAAILTLPMVVYFFWITSGWQRYILIPIALMDIELLLKTQSRPAFIGITFGSLFVMIFLVKDRRKWLLLILILFFLAGLYISGYADFDNRLKDLIVNLSREERVQIYNFAWNVIKDNSPAHWILGHGIGYFSVNFNLPMDAQATSTIFPHSFLFEILYLNGLLGVILIFGGFIFLFGYIVYLVRHSQSKSYRLLINCIIVIFLSWFIHCGLTVPFYSKYSIYPLAFILGILLVIATDRENRIFFDQIKR